MKEFSIKNALNESTTSSSNSSPRPSLVSLTKAVNSLIFIDLVAIQHTSQPIANIFGIKYLNKNKEMLFKSAATYSGEADRSKINEFDKKTQYTKGNKFKHNDIVYSVTSNNPFAGSSLTDNEAIINEAIINGSIRYFSDAADTTKFENNETEISEVNLRIDKWQVPVKTHKIKTEYSIELMQDLEASQLNGNDIVEDMLSSVTSSEINKDIIQKLITVSKRYKVTGVSEKGFLDVTDITDPQAAGRKIYQYIAEMNASILRNSSFRGTYVVASSRVAAILDTSGLLTKSESPLSSGKLNNGLEVYVDINTPMDYCIVGVKHDFNDFEHVGSLFYAPYVENDMSVKIITDPASLQPKAMLMHRYALSVNPYTTTTSDEDSKIINGDDWDNLVGVSNMSMILGIVLPPLYK